MKKDIEPVKFPRGEDLVEEEELDEPSMRRIDRWWSPEVSSGRILGCFGARVRKIDAEVEFAGNIGAEKG